MIVRDELLEVIVEQTNLCAQQFLDSEKVPPSLQVGLLLPIISVQYSPGTNFTRNRFHQEPISPGTDFTPKGQIGHDPLYKIRPVMEPLLHNFKNSHNLGWEIALEESMIGYKGRLSLSSTGPTSQQSGGVKAFVLADSITGYTWG